MKRFLTILICLALSLVMIVAFSSCEDEENSKDESSNSLSNSNTVTSAKYTITFDSNCGVEIQQQQIEEGKRIKEPQTLSREGYVFEGWYIGSEKWIFLEHTVLEDVTLVAKWTPIKYEIKYELSGGVNNTENFSTYNTEQIVELKPPTKDGYNFEGWYNDVEFKNKVTKIPSGETGEKIFYAKWTPIAYTLTYSIDGAMSNKNFTIEDLPLSLEKPTKKNYTFVAWRGFENLSGEAITTITEAKNITIYADFRYGTEGINYSVGEDYVTVTGYEGEDNDIVIPDTFKGKPVTKITAGAFRCSKITSVTIPDSIASIESSAFENCDSLTSITIGNGVRTIGNYAFENCDLLTSVIIGNGVITIGDYAFEDCASLKSATIGNSVTSIGSYAFDYCYKLVEVYNLSSLNIIKGSGGNGYIGGYAKVIHTSLDEPSVLETTSDGYVFAYISDSEVYLVDYIGDDTELTLPESYKGNNYVINEYAFYERDDITKVTIPDGVTLIGGKAFYNCDSLNSITIGYGITSIESYAFYLCESLKMVINKSMLNIQKGYTTYGYIAYYAEEVIKE